MTVFYFAYGGSQIALGVIAHLVVSLIILGLISVDCIPSSLLRMAVIL